MSFGVIDAEGDFGLGALQKNLTVQVTFSEVAGELKRQFEYIDGSFSQGRLDVSDYVQPLWKEANVELEEPILNCDIRRLRLAVSKAVNDDRIRSVILAFLSCCENSGLDVVFSG